jgi:hypothetical protein
MCFHNSQPNPPAHLGCFPYGAAQNAIKKPVTPGMKGYHRFKSLAYLPLTFTDIDKTYTLYIMGVFRILERKSYSIKHRSVCMTFYV